jgi:hypothetical protein
MVSAMAKLWRVVLAGSVLGAALALVFVWIPLTHGHLAGSVHFIGCGGAQPIQIPGQASVPNCNSMLMPGSTVLAVPGSTARFDRDQAGHLIVVPTASGVVSTRSDSHGNFRLDLAPGTYMIGASEPGLEIVEASGLRSQVPPAQSTFREVRIVGGANMTFDITITFIAE